jgi:hypothetical protein
MWYEAGTPTADIVMGNRVTPVVQSLQLAAPTCVALVHGLNGSPESKAKPIEVGTDRSWLGVSAIELALEREVGAYHLAEVGRQSGGDLADCLAVQAATVRLEMRGKQQDERVVELQGVRAASRPRSTDRAMSRFKL